VPLLPRLAGVEPFPTQQSLAATAGPRTEATTAALRFRRLSHTVKRGETLAAVAEKFEVSQKQLRRWNELSSKTRTLKPGRKLVVFVPLPAETTPAKTTETAVVAAVPPSVRPVVNDEEAAARRELAAANAREAARLTTLAEQEKRQTARLAALQQRQESLRKAAASKAAVAARTRQAAEEKAAAQAEAAAKEEDAAVATAGKPRKAVAEAVNDTDNTPAETPETYVVRKGDYLTRIAREYDLTIAQITAWNQLESENVVPGQKLLLHAPAEGEASVEAPRKAAKVAASVPSTKSVAKAGSRTTAEKTSTKTHLVQPGDTLYNISRRFKVSVAELRRLNNLASDEVKLGQKLLLPQG
jgi:membrane-bound lytic murein transglycosylase D